VSQAVRFVQRKYLWRLTVMSVPRQYRVLRIPLLYCPCHDSCAFEAIPSFQRATFRGFIEVFQDAGSVVNVLAHLIMAGSAWITAYC